MGRKLTIRFSTLFNTGLGNDRGALAFWRADGASGVLVHTTKVVHSMVEFIDARSGPAFFA